MKNWFVALFVALLVSGCGGGGSDPAPADSASDSSGNTGSGGGSSADFSSAYRDTANSNFYLSDNNTARLSGPVVGSGAALNSDISRDIAIAYQDGEDPYIKVRRAYASVASPASTTVTLVVQNSSQSTYCGISSYRTKALDISGKELTRFLYFISFLSQADGGRSYTNSCLAPNEIGYVFATGRDFLTADVASVSVGAFEYVDIRSEQGNGLSMITTGAGVVPVSYQLTDNGNSIDILVANRSDKTLDVAFLSYMVLDEAGNLLHTEFLAGEEISEDSPALRLTDEPLLPGAEAYIRDDFQFTGSASTVRVVVDYEVVEEEEPVDVGNFRITRIEHLPLEATGNPLVDIFTVKIYWEGRARLPLIYNTENIQCLGENNVCRDFSFEISEGNSTSPIVLRGECYPLNPQADGTNPITYVDNVWLRDSLGVETQKVVSTIRCR